MTRYASHTTVAPEKSRAEIERVIRRYGATAFAYMGGPQGAAVAFQVNTRQVRFMLPLPDPKDKIFLPKRARTGRSRESAIVAAYELAIRQRWRALALCIKAKLEAVAAGIVTFDEEFLAHLVLPGGKTMGEEYIPQLEGHFSGKSLPPLLGM